MVIGCHLDKCVFSVFGEVYKGQGEGIAGYALECVLVGAADDKNKGCTWAIALLLTTCSRWVDSHIA